MKQIKDIVYNKKKNMRKEMPRIERNHYAYFEDDDYYKQIRLRNPVKPPAVSTGLEKYGQFRNYPYGLTLGDIVYARNNPSGLWFKGKVVEIKRDIMNDISHPEAYAVGVAANGFDTSLNPNYHVRKKGDIIFYTNCVQYGEPSEQCVNNHLY